MGFNLAFKGLTSGGLRCRQHCQFVTSDFLKKIKKLGVINKNIGHCNKYRIVSVVQKSILKKKTFW